MKRKRATTRDMMVKHKERPTMRIELSATEYEPASDRFPVFDVNLRDPHYNALPVAVLNSQGVEVGRCDFLPPIRCTISPPCTHCWYCKSWSKSA